MNVITSENSVSGYLLSSDSRAESKILVATNLI
jgi:hypothetical protein